MTVVRSGNTSAAASVAYSDNGTGTATGGGTHYSFTGGTLNFAAGETKKTFPVTIVDNGTANAPNKTIVFRLANATPAGSQIKTTDGGAYDHRQRGAGHARLRLGRLHRRRGRRRRDRDGEPHRRVEPEAQRRLRDSGGAHRSRDARLTDYTPISPARTLTFDPGEMSKTFQVAIADDSDAEGAETVGLVLSNPRNLTAGAAPQIGPNGPAQLTINDDDVSTFAFTAHEYSVDEEAASGHATISVSRVRRDQHRRVRRLRDERRDRDGRGRGLHDRHRDARLRCRRDGQDVRRPRRQRRRGEANETVNLTLTSGATSL